MKTSKTYIVGGINQCDDCKWDAKIDVDRPCITCNQDYDMYTPKLKTDYED